MRSSADARPTVAVVGHVEWLAAARVDAAPRPGAILHAPRCREEPAGGGGVAAVELARLAGHATLFTALGSDEVGQGIPYAMARHSVTVVGATVPGPHRRAWTLLDPDHERTIVVIGEAQCADRIDPALLAEIDGIYLCKGTVRAARAARAARVLVATARMLPVLREAGVRLDALVRSAADPAESYRDGDLLPRPTLVATTEGALGGHYRLASGEEGRWSAAPLPGAPRDAYGCGDSFAAGLTYALAAGLDAAAACALGADSGALALTRDGAHGSGQGLRATT